MHTIKALFTVGLLALATQASADQLTNLGNLTPPDSLAYGNNFTSSSSGSLFYDDYYFTIPDGSFSSITSSINLSSILGLTDLQARLYSGNSHITASAGTALLQRWGSTVNYAPGLTATTVVLATDRVLAAGTYTLQIRGTVSGSAGGSYSGVLNIAPVPEPDSYAMLLSGLGFIAFTVRRKSRLR